MKVINKVNDFLKQTKVTVKNVGTHGKALSLEIQVSNNKALAFTFQKLLARLKVKLQGEGHRVKNVGNHEKVLLALTFQKLLARLKFMTE